MKMDSICVSFVIPIYRSELTIRKVINDIDALENIQWEAILVNDDSPDNVDREIRKLIRRYPKQITYVELRKNYGQQAAIINGFEFVTKEYVATIDDDGQNPPKEVLKLIKVLRDGDYDVVYGVFKEKKHTYVRNLLSWLNKLVSIATINNKNRIPISNVRVLKKNVVNSISLTSSRNNYIDGLIFSLTDHVGYAYVDHEKRMIGKSSYSFVKLIALWSNHIIGYSNVFIKIITMLSFVISAAAFFAGIIYFMLTIHNAARPTGWLSTYLTITFLFSFTFLFLGIMAEYISRIYTRTNQNKTQLINKVYIHK